jgi:hypothetical protein
MCVSSEARTAAHMRRSAMALGRVATQEAVKDTHARTGTASPASHPAPHVTRWPRPAPLWSVERTNECPAPLAQPSRAAPPRKRRRLYVRLGVAAALRLAGRCAAAAGQRRHSLRRQRLGAKVRAAELLDGLAAAMTTLVVVRKSLGAGMRTGQGQTRLAHQQAAPPDRRHALTAHLLQRQEELLLLPVVQSVRVAHVAERLAGGSGARRAWWRVFGMGRGRVLGGTRCMVRAYSTDLPRAIAERVPTQ